MDSKLTKELTILASQCDSTSRLGIPESFSLCMDLAGEHAEALGNGVAAMMGRGLFWVAVKTKLKFFRRPALMERVGAATWPEPPGRMRQNRDYLLTSQNGEVLAAGKTEWTILDTVHSGLHPIRDGIYAPELEFCAEQACPPPFYRFRDSAGGWEPFCSYTVRSTDIDMGRHMNNAAYARMLAGMFSTEERDRFHPEEVEIHYRASCYEGDTLYLQKRYAEDGSLELRAALEDGKTIILARIVA